MDVFDLQMNFRVVFKNQAQESAAEILGQMGAQRVLLVTDAGIQGAGLDQAYREALAAKGMEVAVFSEVEPNPTTANVEAGLALARRFQPQAFLGIGGGSVLDCAKGINILLNRGGKMAAYAGPQQGGAALLPLVAAPTTAGTGSEVSPFLLISDSDTHAKIVCKDWQAIPKVALLDPGLSLTLPPKATLYAGPGRLGARLRVLCCQGQPALHPGPGAQVHRPGVPEPAQGHGRAQGRGGQGATCS